MPRNCWPKESTHEEAPVLSRDAAGGGPRRRAELGRKRLELQRVEGVRRAANVELGVAQPDAAETADLFEELLLVRPAARREEERGKRRSGV